MKLSDFDKNKQSMDDIAKGGVVKGGRHNAAVAYANHLLFKIQIEYNTFVYEMQRWNNSLEPPMDEKEINRIIKDSFDFFKSKSGENGGQEKI